MKDEEIDWLSIICQILVVIILFQIIWLVNKNVYQTDDCFLEIMCCNCGE